MTRARQVENILANPFVLSLCEQIDRTETPNMRWLRLAAEKLERDRATDTKEADRA